jgi:hypothetical protein
MTDQKQTQTSQPSKSFLSNVMTFVGAIIVILGGAFGVVEFIDWRIEQAVNDEQFIRKVASNVRPYVIFGVDESILVDGGAMQYLEQICVETKGETWENAKPEEKNVCELKIIVTPKSYLAHAPLIEPLSGLRDIIIYDGERSTGYQWTYEVLIRPPYGGDIKTQKFRLEVLR